MKRAFGASGFRRDALEEVMRVLRRTSGVKQVHLVNERRLSRAEGRNSPTIISKHYQQLMAEKQARELCGMMPGTATNVVPFASSAG